MLHLIESSGILGGLSAALPASLIQLREHLAEPNDRRLRKYPHRLAPAARIRAGMTSPRPFCIAKCSPSDKHFKPRP